MASFEERTRLYEVLTRVNPDGSIASQASYISEVLRDGVVISATVNPPVAVDDGDTEAYAAFVSIVGAATAEALLFAQSKDAELQAVIGGQAERIAQLEAQLQGLLKLLPAT